MRFLSLVLLASTGLSVDAQEVPCELDYRRVENFFTESPVRTTAPCILPSCEVIGLTRSLSAIDVRLAFKGIADDV